MKITDVTDILGVVKTFRVSSLSSAAEQRRLFAMYFVLRSSVDSSRWKRKTGTDRRKRKKKMEKSNQGECAMCMTMDGDVKVLRTWAMKCACIITSCGTKMRVQAQCMYATRPLKSRCIVSTSSLVSCLVSCLLYASFQLLFAMMRCSSSHTCSLITYTVAIVFM